MRNNRLLYNRSRYKIHCVDKFKQYFCKKYNVTCKCYIVFNGQEHNCNKDRKLTKGTICIGYLFQNEYDVQRNKVNNIDSNLHGMTK